MRADEASEKAPIVDLYGRLLEEFSAQIGESRAVYGQAARSVREEIVRCVWFGGHYSRQDLRTEDGRRLEVVSPGWWNVEAGPDFIRAEMLLEGVGRLTGDVEVHTLSGGWYAHGHHRQPEYNDVILHVVMWNDRQEPTVEAASGAAIPQLALSGAVGGDMEELVELIDPEAGPADQPALQAVEGKYCGTAYRNGEIEAEWLGRLLDAAGDHRLLRRVAELAELFRTHSREQILYERIAEALGYRGNRMPFLQLAGLLPLAELRRAVPAQDAAARSLTLEAAYFTTAGLLAGPPAGDEDPESAAYREALSCAWERFEPKPPTRLSAEHWKLAGVRPVNYPPRRIAALARLCGAQLHTGLFNHFLRAVHSARAAGRGRDDVAVRHALLNAFLQLEHPYWSFRYTLGGRRLTRARARGRRARHEHPDRRPAAAADGPRARRRGRGPAPAPGRTVAEPPAPGRQLHHPAHGADAVCRQPRRAAGRRLHTPAAGPAPALQGLLPGLGGLRALRAVPGPPGRQEAGRRPLSGRLSRPGSPPDAGGRRARAGRGRRRPASGRSAVRW